MEPVYLFLGAVTLINVICAAACMFSLHYIRVEFDQVIKAINDSN